MLSRYPDFMAVFLRAAEVWFDTPSVTSPLLKFLSEFVFNKNGRITFKPSSPNGILLFRETSKLLVAYGTPQQQQHNKPQHAHNTTLFL